MTGKSDTNNKIVLIRPPTVMRGTSFIATQFPLNIASIAACLLNAGYDTAIWDFDVEPFSENILSEKLKTFSPFLVGISCYTPTVINGHHIARLIKKHLPGAAVVIGGPHVSALPKETLAEFEDFDIGVIGEGEEAMVELADSIRKASGLHDIKGIVYRKDKHSNVINEKRPPIKDLDALPLPARQLLNKGLYKGQSHRGFSRSFLEITEIMTSRGCPNRCIFCASDVVMGPTVRFRTADSVKKEIAECVENLGFTHFAVFDDTFTLREERLYEICDEFMKRKVTWNCNARVWPISQKMLRTMSKSGCKGITFGVESGSPRILKLIKKNITLEQIENAFRWSKEAGVKWVEADVIIGSHPSENKEDIGMTRKLLKKISPDIAMISILVPYPGTEVYNIMKENKMIYRDKSWDSFVLFGKEPTWRTEYFEPRELISIQKSMIQGFYFRPAYAMRILCKIRTIRELVYWVRGGIDFLSDSLKKWLKR